MKAALLLCFINFYIRFSFLKLSLISFPLKDNVDKVKSEIVSNGGQAHSYVCDVRTYDDVSSVAEEVRRDVGDVDILVNNAGILNGGWLLDLSEADIKRTFEVNTLAHFWVRNFSGYY